MKDIYKGVQVFTNLEPKTMTKNWYSEEYFFKTWALSIKTWKYFLPVEKVTLYTNKEIISYLSGYVKERYHIDILAMYDEVKCIVPKETSWYWTRDKLEVLSSIDEKIIVWDNDMFFNAPLKDMYSQNDIFLYPCAFQSMEMLDNNCWWKYYDLLRILPRLWEEWIANTEVTSHTVSLQKYAINVWLMFGNFRERSKKLKTWVDKQEAGLKWEDAIIVEQLFLAVEMAKKRENVAYFYGDVTDPGDEYSSCEKMKNAGFFHALGHLKNDVLAKEYVLWFYQGLHA